MAALAEIFSAAGCGDVRTYIQSGNVVFEAPVEQDASLEDRLEAAIAESIGVTTRVTNRSAGELASIVEGNPFPPEYTDKVAVAFLSDEPASPNLEAIDEMKHPAEEIRLSGQDAYLYYPNGQGRSKMTTTLIEKHLGVRATVRNWRTVNKLLELASE